MINIDKPKWFINELAYQSSINNLITGYTSGIEDVDIWATEELGVLGGVVEKPCPIFNHPEKPFISPYASYVGTENPTMTLMMFALKEGYWNDIFLDEENTNMADSSQGSYIAFLGHSIPDMAVGWNFDPISIYSSESEWPASFAFGADGQASAFEKIIASPAFNWNNFAAGGEFGFTVPGWSMAKDLKFGMVSKCKTLYIQIPLEVPFGCISLGNYTRLAHNPNAGYQVELLQDGIKYKTSKGGGSFSYSNYRNSPKWTGGGAAWEVGYIAEDEGTAVYFPAPSRPRVGRRSYNMQWEGFADTSILPTNTLNTPYKDLGFADNDTVLDGNTLYNQILMKTLDSSFIFQQDSTSIDPQNFMIGRWASPNMAFPQLSHKIYGYSNTIIESW